MDVGQVESLPGQGWAHRDGKIAMRPLGPADWGPAAISARLQIGEAFARFALAHDEARTDIIGSCFTEDAVFEVAEGQAAPFVRCRGRQEITRQITAVLAAQNDQRRHCISNVLVETLTDTSASALAYGLVSVAGRDVTLGASVLYVADLARGADDVWRFSSFFIGMDRYAGTKPGE
jgi:ketosteroid isomerase-like protein